MQVPVDILHWLLALAPIIVLAFLLVQLRWTAQQAGALGIFVTAVIAVLAFETPWETLSVASAKGVWDAIFILAVIWPALLLYQVMNRSGGYEAMRQGITRMSRNELFIIVALGWVFTSFLQGIDGFGTPIAIVAPLLVAFGVKPVYAVAIPIIAHIWAKFYGTLGAGWLATLQLVSLDEAATLEFAFQSAVLIVIQTFLGGFTVVWLYGRWAAVKHGWPLVVIVAAIQGFGQMVAVFIDPVLAAFLPATVALLALYPLSRWRRYAEPAEGITERPAMAAEALTITDEKKPPMSTAMSFLPYILLSIFAVGSSVIPALSTLLRSWSVGLPFPEVSTGFGVVRNATDMYSPLSPLSHPGFVVLLVALIAWVLFRARGFFASWNRQSPQPGTMLGALARTAVPASVPILAFLVMAQMMNHSGQNDALALGIAAVAPAYVYAFLANGIGAIGAFTTSSSTSSNVLFSDMQVKMAELKGLSVPTILAAQSAGGAIGNAIAPANIVMGASTVGIVGKEGEIMRKTLPWTLAAVGLTGIATVVVVMVGA